MPSGSQMRLTREELAQFLPTHKAIKAFEKALYSVGFTLPSTIEEANAVAASAVSAANLAIGMLADLVGALDGLLMAPTAQTAHDHDDYSPRHELGSMAAQNYDHVDITGGTVGLDKGLVSAVSLYWFGQKTTGFYWKANNDIAFAANGVKLFNCSEELFELDGALNIASGSVSEPSVYWNSQTTTGFYGSGSHEVSFSVSGTNLLSFSTELVDVVGDVQASKQLKSTVATGTAPLVVSSTTLVNNLYVDRAVLADTATILTVPTSFPANATDLPTAITLVNAIKAAGVAKGL